jgi:hypothetical protein
MLPQERNAINGRFTTRIVLRTGDASPCGVRDTRDVAFAAFVVSEL